jgi:hypothetical protein
MDLICYEEVKYNFIEQTNECNICYELFYENFKCKMEGAFRAHCLSLMQCHARSRYSTHSIGLAVRLSQPATLGATAQRLHRCSTAGSDPRTRPAPSDLINRARPARDCRGNRDCRACNTRGIP